MNDIKEERETLRLLPELINLINQHGKLYKQERIFNRVLGLVMAELFTFARHTITQLLLALGLTGDDWSAWYRLFSEERFDAEGASSVMAQEMVGEVAATEPFTMGADGFHVPRCSRKMPGTGWMPGLRTARFNSGSERGQRYVEGSWLTPIENGYSRAVPLRCVPAFTQKSVPAAEAPRTEVEAGLAIVAWMRQQMDEAGREEQVLMTLGDGHYDTLDFWPGLPTNTIAVVRTPRNRCLYHLPDEGAHGNCKYGDKAPAPREWLQKRKGFTIKHVLVRGRQRRMRYRVEGPFIRDGLPDIPLWLIVVGGGKRPPGSRRKQYHPCFFLVSAIAVDGVLSLPRPIAELLVWLWQRWELEVAHRQMKSSLGLGEKQNWHPKSTVATVQWSVWVYSLLLLSGLRVWGNTAGPPSPGRWRNAPKRWSFNTLWRGFRAELWGNPQFRATWTRSRANWLEFEVLWQSLFNSVLASARA